MSNPAPTVDDAPAATGGEEASSQDGWRTGGLPALRAELDRIDDAVHDLLMQRAGIVEYVARSGKPAAFRPGREASMIRRLLARHHGSLPPSAVVRIWRELLAGTTAMQGVVTIAVCDTDPGLPMTQLVREHFGVLTPLRQCGDIAQALAAVARGQATVAVLPYPPQGWITLLPQQEPRLHVIGRLPFWQPRAEGAPIAQALVVASTPADSSENDRTLIAISRDVSRAVLEAAGLRCLELMPAGEAQAVAEVEGRLAEGDPRLAQLPDPFVLGHYAVPIAGDTR